MHRGTFSLGCPGGRVFAGIRLTGCVGTCTRICRNGGLIVKPRVIMGNGRGGFTGFVGGGLPDTLDGVGGVCCRSAVTGTVLFETVSGLCNAGGSRAGVNRLGRIMMPCAVSLLAVLAGGHLGLCGV